MDLYLDVLSTDKLYHIVHKSQSNETLPIILSIN